MKKDPLYLEGTSIEPTKEYGYTYLYPLLEG